MRMYYTKEMQDANGKYIVCCLADSDCREVVELFNREKTPFRERGVGLHHSFSVEGSCYRQSYTFYMFVDQWDHYRVSNSDGARKKYSALHAKGYDIHNGYVRISVGKNCGRLQHVVIMEQHIGRKLSKNEVVHHINGVKTDNRIENLKLMTNTEHSSLHAKLNVLRGNNYDISKHSKSGEDHHMAKLTWKDVDYIRASNKSTKELMKMFNMSKSAIEKVKSYKSWRINNVN